MTVRARSINAITLARSGFAEYQITYWNDGVARFDGRHGQRQGAWTARVPGSWFGAAAKLARNLESGWRRKDDDSVTIVLDTVDARLMYEGPAADEPPSLWVLSTLIDGMSQRTTWAPLDVTGADDFEKFGSGTPLWMSVGGATATGFGLAGAVLVLAGSRASTSTSGSLEDPYQSARTALIDGGALSLLDDLFLLSRHLLFDSPSAAASVMAGSNTNGRRAWKDSLGRTWSDLDL